ncbi:cytosine permease [Comamonas sp.]|uniref:purine-cytosine permease family protein n=1 Tax=Comamonas sp. TaxID=34028 RepID=UPI00095B5425|nr:cytosine permease [Comamonas sp.]MBN9331579.1 cytosine permease [Comamonas sp.]OJW99021.1 MAG: allantoin permease [Burkholderiales bacterium 66-26]
MSTNQPATNEALTPLHEGQRAFGWRDHTSLWFSLGVGLLVMQMGAYLLPGLSPGEALVAIAIGSIVGSGLLGWVGKLGCDSGLASAGLMHAVYGRRFAGLPIVLNVLQLLGWGAFELVIMRDATVAIGRQSGGLTAGYWSVLATLMWGAVVLLLISGSMVRLVRRLISRIALPLVVLSLLWLSWQFATLAQTQGLAPLWGRGGDGSMSALSAIDLVIAMPVSWLPLVADYARHGRNGRSALHGTWLGYAVANIWCYGLGVLVALVLPSEDLVTALLLAQGGLIALSLIIVDEIDNTYGDVYSGSVCMHSLLPRWSIRRWGVLMVLACTAFALVLPMHSLEPFLLLLGSVFVPLFGVILGRLAFGAPTRQLLHEAGSIHWGATLIWLAGIAFYHLLPRLAPALGGSALPTLVLCFALAWLSRSSFK